MKTFVCGRCDAQIYFDNTACMQCGAQLAFVPDEIGFMAFEYPFVIAPPALEKLRFVQPVLQQAVAPLELEAA